MTAAVLFNVLPANNLFIFFSFLDFFPSKSVKHNLCLCTDRLLTGVMAVCIFFDCVYECLSKLVILCLPHA